MAMFERANNIAYNIPFSNNIVAIYSQNIYSVHRCSNELHCNPFIKAWKLTVGLFFFLSANLKTHITGNKNLKFIFKLFQFRSHLWELIKPQMNVFNKIRLQVCRILEGTVLLFHITNNNQWFGVVLTHIIIIIKSLSCPPIQLALSQIIWEYLKKCQKLNQYFRSLKYFL